MRGRSGGDDLRVLTMDVGYSTLTSPIITLVVGREQRLFAAHEDVLSLSPFFVAALRGQFFESTTKQVQLPDECVYSLHPHDSGERALMTVSQRT